MMDPQVLHWHFRISGQEKLYCCLLATIKIEYALSIIGLSEADDISFAVTDVGL